MITLTIDIVKSEQTRRFEQATWKQGKMLEQPQSVRQVYNIQADHEETADKGLMDSMFDKWVWEGVRIISEYVSGTPGYSDNPTNDVFSINVKMPRNWPTDSFPSLKYALCELVYNGMMADWYENMKPDSALAYKKNADLNKAQIHSIIYSLNAPRR